VPGDAKFRRVSIRFSPFPRTNRVKLEPVAFGAGASIFDNRLCNLSLDAEIYDSLVKRSSKQGSADWIRRVLEKSRPEI